MLQPLPKRAPRGYRTLYHVTLKSNADSIHEHGLSPRFAQTAVPAVYLVEHRRILWALAHVSKRHEVHVGEIEVWRCHVLVRDLRRVNGGHGLWCTPYAVYFCEQRIGWSLDKLPKGLSHENGTGEHQQRARHNPQTTVSPPHLL